MFSQMKWTTVLLIAAAVTFLIWNAFFPTAAWLGYLLVGMVAALVQPYFGFFSSFVVPFLALLATPFALFKLAERWGGHYGFRHLLIAVGFYFVGAFLAWIFVAKSEKSDDDEEAKAAAEAETARLRKDGLGSMG